MDDATRQSLINIEIELGRLFVEQRRTNTLIHTGLLGLISLIGCDRKNPAQVDKALTVATTAVDLLNKAMEG